MAMPMSQPALALPDPGALLSALTVELECYRELSKLAARQHECVLEDHTEGLLDVLNARGEVLERISALERTIGPARRNWAAFAPRLSPLDRARAEQLMGEVRSILAAITASDERDALALQQRKHRIGTEIRATTSATAVNRSYAASAYGKPPPRGVDRQL